MNETINSPDLEVIYLHGFASGPKSSKAVFFSKKITELGMAIHIPDLNRPDFEHMTLSSQLQVVDDVIGNLSTKNPKVLMGSSMGGLIATIKAGQMVELDLKALILFAPGFGLAKRWPALFGEQNLNTWKERGVLDVYNYAVGKNLPLSYEFFEDINQHETELLTVKVPTLIFHGSLDETVPIGESESFAKRNSEYTTLYALNDDHQLLASLENIWVQCKELLSRL